MEKRAITWRELKQFIETIDEKHLDNKVRWWEDERGGIINSIWILDEDYTRVSEEYWEPISIYEKDESLWEEYREDIEKSPKIIKGTPILTID